MFNLDPELKGAKAHVLNEPTSGPATPARVTAGTGGKGIPGRTFLPTGKEHEGDAYETPRDESLSFDRVRF